MKLGLHQGSALLFIIIMDVLGEKYRTKPPWDYNLNLLKINNDELCSEFFDLITSHSLLPQITLPTRLSQISGTLIDNILCKAHIYISNQQRQEYC